MEYIMLPGFSWRSVGRSQFCNVNFLQYANENMRSLCCTPNIDCLSGWLHVLFPHFPHFSHSPLLLTLNLFIKAPMPASVQNLQNESTLGFSSIKMGPSLLFFYIRTFFQPLPPFNGRQVHVYSLSLIGLRRFPQTFRHFSLIACF